MQTHTFHGFGSPPSNVLIYVTHKTIAYCTSTLSYARHMRMHFNTARIVVIQTLYYSGKSWQALRAIPEKSCSCILSVFNATSAASSCSSGIRKQQPVLTKHKCGLRLIVYR